MPNGDVCPGENITFTCITTDALGLIWRQPLFSNVPFDDIKDEPKSEGRFSFVLLDVVNSTTFISTATLKNASESDNSTRITCSDGTDTEEESISIAVGPNMTANDGQVRLDYNSDTVTVDITWDRPAAERCIVEYRVYINSSVPECSIDTKTENTYFTLSFTDECHNANYNGFLESEDRGSRTGPPVPFEFRDPENVIASTIDYRCECINDDQLKISLGWDAVSSDISTLAVEYLVSVNISDVTMTVNNSVAQFVVPITDYCFFASIKSTNGFRNGTEISGSVTCSCPRTCTDATNDTSDGSGGSGSDGSGSGDLRDDGSDDGPRHLGEIIGGVLAGVVVVTGGTTGLLIGGIFIYKKKKGK